jgi:hypothetical protein
MWAQAPRRLRHRINGVAGHQESHTDGLRRRLGRLHPLKSHDSNYRHMPANQLSDERRLPIALTGLNITGIAFCCARTARGHAAAVPSPAMNSRYVVT